jgi:hypothetical protein
VLDLGGEPVTLDELFEVILPESELVQQPPSALSPDDPPALPLVLTAVDLPPGLPCLPPLTGKDVVAAASSAILATDQDVLEFLTATYETSLDGDGLQLALDAVRVSHLAGERAALEALLSQDFANAADPSQALQQYLEQRLGSLPSFL